MAELHGKNGAFYAARGIIRAKTLAFTLSPSTITDSGNGLVTAGFLQGMKIVVTGSSGNNNTFTIATGGVAAGALTLTGSPATSPEDAGNMVTIYEAAPGGAPVGFTNWSLDWKNDPLDATDFQDAGAKTFIPGDTSWTASGERNFSADDNIWGGSVNGSIQWVRLFTHYEAIPSTGASAALYYEGLAIVTTSDIEWPADGLVTQKYEFQGISALTPVSKTSAW